MGNVNRSNNCSFCFNINTYDQVIEEDTMNLILSKRMPILSMEEAEIAIKQNDIQKLQQLFEINVYSFLSNINFRDITKYQNAFHLAYHLQRDVSIEYLMALSVTTKTTQIALWIKDYNGFNIFDMSMSQGKKEVEKLRRYEEIIQSYPLNFALMCQSEKIYFHKRESATFQTHLLQKFNLRLENEIVIQRYFDQNLVEQHNLIVKQYCTFFPLKLSQILKQRVNQIFVFPSEFCLDDIQQSPFIDDCQLVSIVQSLIIQRHFALIYSTISCEKDCSITFSGKYNILIFKNMEPINILVDDIFIYSISKSQCFTSKIGKNSIFFNFLEKAWIKQRGGYLNKCAYSVDEAILDILNIPVLSRQIICPLNEYSLINLLAEIKKFLLQKYLVIATTNKNGRLFQGLYHSLVFKEVNDNYSVQFLNTYPIKDTFNITISLEQIREEICYISIGVIRDNFQTRLIKIVTSELNIEMDILSDFNQLVNFSLYFEEIEELSCVMRREKEEIIMIDKEINNYFNLSNSSIQTEFTELIGGQHYDVSINFTKYKKFPRIVRFCYYSQFELKVSTN